jgi:phosphoglycerate dehydrogenase-like enzyme
VSPGLSSAWRCCGIVRCVDIAVLDDYADAAPELADWSRLQAQGRVDFFTDLLIDSDSLAERLAPYEAVVLMRERTAFPATVIDRLDRLRLIITTGARNPALDVAAAHARGILVCRTGGISSSTVELTWALILAHSRHLVSESTTLAAGGWQSTIGRDLAGATLGVLGLGRIGSKVATVGRAFDMDVIAWSRTLDDERAAEVGAESVTYSDMLSRADILTIHVPLNPTTRGLIGREALAAMKPTALLVNTSRAPIVDGTALREALAAGELGGAAVDVFDVEPPPDDEPLRTAEGVLATPHLGYVTRNGMSRFYRDAVEDVEAYLAGTPIRVVET